MGHEKSQSQMRRPKWLRTREMARDTVQRRMVDQGTQQTRAAVVQQEVALAPATLQVKAQAELEQARDAAQQEKVQAQLPDAVLERETGGEADPDQERSRESRFKRRSGRRRSTSLYDRRADSLWYDGCRDCQQRRRSR